MNLILMLATLMWQPETSSLRVGTFNVQALSARDSKVRFDKVSQAIKDAGFPQVLALQEIADNDGDTNTGTTDASLTLERLREAVRNAGGPWYAALSVPPENNAEGGPPGANIRSVLLTTLEVSGPLFALGTQDPAFKNTRRPLHVRLGSFDVLVVHLTAGPTYAAKRALQGARLAQFVSSLPNPRRVLLLGDFNADGHEALWAPLNNAGLVDTTVLHTQATHASGHTFDRILLGAELEASGIPQVLPRTAASDHALVFLDLRGSNESRSPGGCGFTPKGRRAGWTVVGLSVLGFGQVRRRRRLN